LLLQFTSLSGNIHFVNGLGHENKVGERFLAKGGHWIWSVSAVN